MTSRNPKHISLSQKEFLIARQIAKEIEWVLYSKDPQAVDIRNQVIKYNAVISLKPSWKMRRFGSGKELPLFVTVRRAEDDDVIAYVSRNTGPYISMTVYLDTMLDRNFNNNRILSTIVHELTHVVDKGMPYAKIADGEGISKSEDMMKEYYLSRHEIDAFVNSMWLSVRSHIKEVVDQVKIEAKNKGGVINVASLSEYLRDFYVKKLRGEMLVNLIKEGFGAVGFKAIMEDEFAKKRVMAKVYDIFMDLTSTDSIQNLIGEKGAGRKRAAK